MPLNSSESTLSKLSGPWDAIIIGSGLGGMTTANILARRGKKVLILERHTVPGGFTHTFKRKGFEWDVGVHYVGQVSKPKAILRRIFNHLTEGELEWADMGPVYDRAVIGGTTYEFPVGQKEFEKKLISYFPSEAQAIRKYLSLVARASRTSPWFFSEKSVPAWFGFLFSKWMRSGFLKYSQQTTYEVLSALTQNKRLIAVLCAQCGDYGLPPRQSSFGMHAVLVDHYLKGGAYPVGGARRIHETLLSVLKKNGGELALKQEVQQIIVENGKTIGVQLKTGEVIKAPIVVSNAGFRNTVEKLLPSHHAATLQLQSELSKVEPSQSHVCLYIGLRGSDEELKLPKSNYWIYENENFDELFAERLKNIEQSLPFAYISFPSAKDPDWHKKHAGTSTIQIISACPYEITQPWEDQSWRRRDEAYEAFKSKVSDQLIKILLDHFPHLKDRIEYHELSTPLSTRHFMNYQRGEIYGLAHTPARFLLEGLRPYTGIPGVYMTGQDITTVGVGGALFSGVITASKIVNRPLMFSVLS